MEEQTIRLYIEQILINHFKVSKEKIQWDATLASLHEEFKILGVLLDLENLLNEKFKTSISLIQNIDVGYHTLMDIVMLIKEENNS